MLRVERRWVRVELDPKVFKPCEVVRLARGVLRKKILLVHFDGSRWRVLLVRHDGRVESFTLS